MSKDINDLDESAVDTLTDVVNTLSFVRNYPNDQVIHDLSTILSGVFRLVNAASNTDLIEVLERALQDPELDKTLLNPPQAGVMKLMSAMQDDDVQRGLGIMIALLKAMGKAANEREG